MRVSYKWLRDYVQVDLSPSELGDKLTLAGIAVEEIIDLGEPYRALRVGRIEEIKPHPEAGNLLVCLVQISDGRVTVITAARNLQPGDVVPVILSGARLPNGNLIEETMFKGIKSSGMLCSEEELGLARSSQGIMTLPPGTPLDAELPKVLGLDDTVFVLELTANRADCYGMLGVAREVAAITGQELTYPEMTFTESEISVHDLARVSVEDPDLCPRYAGRVLLDLKIGESPLWLKTRLLAAGMRPINNMVDITNYVMLEMNQPLHAFDLDQIAEKKIVVRRARSQERLITLDEQERELNEEVLLIADAQKGQCLAGVMGGCDSEVSAGTSRVFLESAYFSPVSIRRTSQRYALRSEAALRFGKGLDQAGVVNALDRTAHLVQSLGIGRVAKGVIDIEESPVKPRKVLFRPEKINSLLGTELSTAYMVDTLARLSFKMVTEENKDYVLAPTYRLDVENDADLAEEIARLYGYDNIPTTFPQTKEVGVLSPRQEFEAKLRHLMLGYGLTEVMNYSFHGKRVFDRMRIPVGHELRRTVEMMVPLSEEGSIMRTTLLAGILETLSYNAKRKHDDLSVFELARVYLPTEQGALPQEPLYLGGALMGRAFEAGWAQPQKQVDFYDAKGIIERLLTDLRIRGWSFKPQTHPSLHPGRTAVLEVNGESCGYIGEIHPAVKEEYNLNSTAILFELNIEALWAAVEERSFKVKPIPKFPPVLRDLAIVLPQEVSVQEIQDLFRRVGGAALEDFHLFDVYQGENIPVGQRSLAFSLTFRLEDRTLQDDEVNTVIERIIQELSARFQATIRR